MLRAPAWGSAQSPLKILPAARKSGIALLCATGHRAWRACGSRACLLCGGAGISVPGTLFLQTETWSEPPFFHPTPPPGSNSRALPPARPGAVRGSRGASCPAGPRREGRQQRVEPGAQGAAGTGSHAGFRGRRSRRCFWAGPGVRGAEGDCFSSFEVQASLAGKGEGSGTLRSSRGSCGSEPVSESTRGEGRRSLRASGNKLGLTWATQPSFRPRERRGLRLRGAGHSWPRVLQWRGA